MNKMITAAVLLGAAGCVAATAAADVRTQAEVRRARTAQIEQSMRQQRRVPSPLGATGKMTALVRLADGADASELEAEGIYEVQRLRGPFAIVSCSPEDALRLEAHRSVRQCEFNRRVTPQMAATRALTGIDAIQEGTELPRAYTGKGVVTGIVDMGYDPNHVNFLDEEGNNRIAYLFDIDVTQQGNIRTTPYPASQLKMYTTDTPDETHGTHTMGIMAGGYRGEVNLAQYDPATGKSTTATVQNPHWGVAPEATIMASTGAGYESTIAYGVDAILDYRWNEGYRDCPVVVNLSLGGNDGAHDGSSVLAQYLDWAEENDGLISVIAAGNSGDLDVALTHTFAEDDEEVKTLVTPVVYSDLRYGSVSIYSVDNNPLDVSVIIYNAERGSIARTFPLNNTDGTIQYICSPGQAQEETDIEDATFGKAYRGYVGLVGTYDENTGRFMAYVDIYCENAETNPADPETSEAQYTLGIVVKGKKGQRIDCYTDAEYTAFGTYGYEGFTPGSPNGSISDLATCKTAIVVGSYNSTALVGCMDGNVKGNAKLFPDGDVTSFSSFGTLSDGRSLPHVLAPGSQVVSSASSYYVENADHPTDRSELAGMAGANARKHYYMPMMGTSMATPVVTGSIALWLEADPTLTYADCLEIMQQTAKADEHCLAEPDAAKYGYGKFDAYAGLKEVLKRTGIGTVAQEAPRLLVRNMGGNLFEVFQADAEELDMRLHSLSGSLVARTTQAGREAMFDASAVAPGIYVLTVNGSHAAKLIVK